MDNTDYLSGSISDKRNIKFEVTEIFNGNKNVDFFRTKRCTKLAISCAPVFEKMDWPILLFDACVNEMFELDSCDCEFCIRWINRFDHD